MSQPMALYTVAQVRAFDAHAIKVLGVPGYALMQRAAEAALQVLQQRWPAARTLTVVCGGGNNGGDGYVLACLAVEAGLSVMVLGLEPAGELRGDALRAYGDYVALDRHVNPFNAAALAAADVIVDGLLGTGARAPMREPYAAAIHAINAAGKPVLALDLPSGLDGDTGEVIGVAIRAACTVTFVAPKQGLLLGSGPDLCGELHCRDLRVQLPTGAAAEPALRCLDSSVIATALPPRTRDCHKGDFGRVLIVGGGLGMPGAVRLAGEACLRVGAGMVTIATAAVHAASIAAARPELICMGIADADSLAPLLSAASVVVVGPGMGRSDWAISLLAAALGAGKPLVLDADALNVLAEKSWRVPPASILTPHPGEAGRLLGCSTAEIQRDRPAALKRLVSKLQAVVVLKGAGTLLGAPQTTPMLCTAGNPGMAGPGMGDVLTGAIAGILAQCRDPWLAAAAGVQAHAAAGDDEARRVGSRGLLAEEVAIAMTRHVNGLA